MKRNSRALYDEFHRILEDRAMRDRVDLGWQSCFGRCTQGPNCLVKELLPDPPGGRSGRFAFATLPQRRGGRSALYNGVTEPDVTEVIDSHIAEGRVVRRLIQRAVHSAPVADSAAPTNPNENAPTQAGTTDAGPTDSSGE